MAKSMKFLGVPYPIVQHPRGYLRSSAGINQIKSDLLQLLLTNPGERCMLPNYGTPLKKLIFDQNDSTFSANVQAVIAAAITQWEPRITVQQIIVNNAVDQNLLDPQDLKQDLDNVVSITITFFDPNNIQEVDDVTIELPVGGGQ